MPANSTQLVELTLELDDVSYNCQLIDPEHTVPAYAVSTTATETACPGGIVNESTGAWTPGGLKGNVFADPLVTGLTWILRTALHNQATLTYRIVHAPELGPTGAIEETGDAKVASFSYGRFAKPGMWKHPIDLQLLTTSGPTRPAAADAA